MQYFIVINDVQQGPFSIDELRQRNITSDTLVWAEGMPQWTPAWQVEELRPLFYADAQTGQPTAAQQGPTPPPYGTQNGAQPGSMPGGNYQGPGAGGTTPPPYQPEKSNRKKVLTYVGIAVAILLLIMAITNPSKDEHRQVVKDHITSDHAPVVADITYLGPYKYFHSGWPPENPSYSAASSPLSDFESGGYRTEVSETAVSLEARNEMAPMLIDRFGKDITLIPKGKDCFTTYVDVMLSRQFLGWIMALGDGIRITGPEKAVLWMKAEVERLKRDYS